MSGTRLHTRAHRMQRIVQSSSFRADTWAFLPILGLTMERLHDVCSGRFRSVVKLGNFSCMANCYAGLNGRDRPRAPACRRLEFPHRPDARGSRVWLPCQMRRTRMCLYSVNFPASCACSSMGPSSRFSNRSYSITVSPLMRTRQALSLTRSWNSHHCPGSMCG